MSKFLEETPYASNVTAVSTCGYTGWTGGVELHWCEGCGILIKNGSLIIHPPGESKALWFCDSRCKKAYDKKGPHTHGQGGEEFWG